MSSMQMKLPKISVITPSLNQAQFLEQTILSVLGQGYPNIEYIIIDGGSTDGSAEIIRRYSDRLAYWESQQDRGQAHAINKGFERASGDILCWINSDDFFLPGVFHHVARSMSPDDSAELLYGRCLVFHDQGMWAVVHHPVSPFDRELFRALDFLDQPSTFWTRRLWEATGLLDEALHYAFDWDWFNRAADYGTFKSSPHIFSRVHHDLGYTVPSTTGGTDHVTLSRYSNPYHRGLRFDELDRGRVCGLGAAL